MNLEIIRNRVEEDFSEFRKIWIQPCSIGKEVVLCITLFNDLGYRMVFSNRLPTSSVNYQNVSELIKSVRS